MPPLKKGAYCFAPVSRSVDQAMSAHYLLTPLHGSGQIWYNRCPLGNRWPLLILRSHGQRSRSNCWSLKWCPLNILTLLLESGQTWYNWCPWGVDDSYWFWSHMVKGQGQTAGLWRNVFSIPLLESGHICYNWCP